MLMLAVQSWSIQLLEVLPVAQWLMSFDVVFVLVLFIVYLTFLAQAKTYFAEVWLQFVICESSTVILCFVCQLCHAITTACV